MHVDMFTYLIIREENNFRYVSFARKSQLVTVYEWEYIYVNIINKKTTYLKSL